MSTGFLRGLLAALILTGAGSALALDTGPGALSRGFQQLAQSNVNLGCVEACAGVALRCKRGCSGRGLTAGGETACQNQCQVDQKSCAARCPPKSN